MNNYSMFLFSDCDPLTAPGNGKIVNPLDVSFQSVIRFECNDGFNLIGNATRQCSVNSSVGAAAMYWTDTTPTCEIKGIRSCHFNITIIHYKLWFKNNNTINYENSVCKSRYFGIL